MKILYVGGLSGPLKDIISGKKENEITHAAQFFHPWYQLVQKGHQVDFVVSSNFNDPITINVDWFSEDNLYANVYDPYSELPWYRRIFRRIKRFTKLLYYTNKAVKQNQYDFIYCLTYYEGLAGNIIANWYGIPCGMRSMGTMLNEDFKKHGIKGTAWRRPIEYIMYKMNKRFILMTDDGTKGDVVYDAWKPQPEKYDFHFWKTGIDMTQIDELESDLKLPEHDYLFFAARIEQWKRHDRVIKTLHLLHQNGRKLHLYFAGKVQTYTYYDEIKKQITEYHLDDYVHFLGAIKQVDVKLMAYHATANLSMYDVSNLGNVFFEIFSIGSIVIGINDGTLDDYLKHQENGFIVDNEQMACEIILELLENQELVQQIRTNAIDFASKHVLSCEERFGREVDLIEQCCEAAQIHTKQKE